VVTHFLRRDGRRPFRLGTTSQPVPNVEFLGRRVDDVELALFESDESSNVPDPAARWEDT
jgi:hypothetical protein